MAEGWTSKQGQYLAFIYHYGKINGRPPAEADIQRYFSVSPPTVHNMVMKLDELGFISRTPRMSRSIKLLVNPRELPWLE